MLVTFGFDFSRGRGSADTTLRNRTENGSAGNYLYYWFYLDQRALEVHNRTHRRHFKTDKVPSVPDLGIVWRVLRNECMP